MNACIETGVEVSATGVVEGSTPGVAVEAKASASVNHYVKTAHFEQRQAQRKITDQIVALAVSRGRRFYEGDDRVYFLRRRDLPTNLSPETLRRADGTVVVVSADGALLTTFRNPVYLRTLKQRQH